MLVLVFQRREAHMSTPPSYAVQTIERGPMVSRFDITVGLMILFVFAVAVLGLW